MAILNITLNGVSADYKHDVDAQLIDRDIKRLALEVIRSGEVAGLWIASLPSNTFDNYVVDRFHSKRGGQRIYLRPRVPFGAATFMG
jgi:hypothetical protein